MELFVTKNGNSWELLLIVVRELSLKCDEAPKVRHLHVQSQQQQKKPPLEQRVKYILS